MNQRKFRLYAAMTKAWVGGATLEEVGQKFGVTRQRVHQVIKRPNLIKNHARRRESNRSFIAEYNSTPVCQRCRELLQFNGRKKVGAVL